MPYFLQKKKTKKTLQTDKACRVNVYSLESLGLIQLTQTSYLAMLGREWIEYGTNMDFVVQVEVEITVEI